MADRHEEAPSGTETPVPPETSGKAAKHLGRRFWTILLAVVIGIVVYAYAFDATGVNLDEIQDPTRQASLVRILRAIAHPDLLTYEAVETNLDVQFMSPCPPGGFTPEEQDAGGPRITATPSCVEPGGNITVTGSGFDANRRGDILYIASSGVEIRLGNFLTDKSGQFTEVVGTRERSSDQPQTIRVVTAINVGSIFHWQRVPTGRFDAKTGEEVIVTSPRISNTAWDTWDKIIETVFLAFIATTIGTLIAVPLSFFAARNLMRDIAVPLMALTSGVLFGMIGIGAGLIMLRMTRTAADAFTGSVWVAIVMLVALLAAVWFAVRWAMPQSEEDEPPLRVRATRIAVVAASVVGLVIALFLVAAIMSEVGGWLGDHLGPLTFLGLFVGNLGDILHLLVSGGVALITGFVFMFIGTRLGLALRRRLPEAAVQPVNTLLAILAGAAAAVLLAQSIAWLYEITDPAKTLWWPALVGGLLGLGGAFLARRKESVGIGLSVYYFARTVFNAIRAIEPLVMVIIFVVWVGLGAFAGSIALALHTTAALAKLYSEQVESIDTDPIEAIKATGATRMQTIIYGVVPQIVPPYISFTMYRWDINVRMSTIIGFAGGGGIGFLLQQNINLLNYRAAAVQMLAIAIVVASLDYVSSRLRERVV